jgi:cytochrome P450
MRGPWFDSLRTDSHTGNVVSERNPRKHKHRRQLLAGALSGKDIPGAETTIDAHVQNWMKILDKQLLSIQNGELQVNLSRTLSFLSMDIITHLCFNEPFGNVESDTDRYGLIQILSSAMVMQQYQASLPELNAFLHWLGRLPFLRDIVFPSVRSPGGFGELMRMIQRKIEERTADSHDRSPTADMLDSFLARGLDVKVAASEIVVVL